MTIGNMGPRRTPMKETVMALPIREGVNHIIISKLFDLKENSVHIRKFEFETYPSARKA
jgi:hypothetical protein